MSQARRGTLHNPATGEEVEVDLRYPLETRRAAQSLIETPEQWLLRRIKGLFRLSRRNDRFHRR